MPVVNDTDMWIAAILHRGHHEGNQIAEEAANMPGWPIISRLVSDTAAAVGGVEANQPWREGSTVWADRIHRVKILSRWQW